MRPFTMVPPNVWKSPVLKSLPDDARVMWLYYYCGPHQSICGVSYVPDAYAADDLGWDIDKCARARKRLMDAGVIQYDPNTCEVLVTGWYEQNCPMGATHLTGYRKAMAMVQSEKLRTDAEEAMNRERERRQAGKTAPENVTDHPNREMAKRKMGGIWS